MKKTLTINDPSFAGLRNTQDINLVELGNFGQMLGYLADNKTGGVVDDAPSPNAASYTVPVSLGAGKIKAGFVCLAAALGLALPSLARTMPAGDSPTQDQLLRGRELLQRVMSVAAKVPLFDAETVLGELGFRQIWIASYPRYVGVYPKGKDGSALPSELKGTGFVSISVDPWRLPDSYSRELAALTARFDLETACVSVADASAMLGSPLQTYPIVYAHPVESPPRQHEVGIARYAPPKTPVGGIDAFVGLTFDYQTCARSMRLGYLLRTEEGKK